MKAKRIKALSLFWTIHRNGYVGPAWELPNTSDHYDLMVEQMAKAMWEHQWNQFGPIMRGTWSEDERNHWRDHACTALRAIGITSPKKGRK